MKASKKVLALVLALAMVLSCGITGVFAAAPGQGAKDSGSVDVTVNPASVTLKMGETVTKEVTVTTKITDSGNGYLDKVEIVAESGDASIAAAAVSGGKVTITAVKDGGTMVTVYAVKGGKYYGTAVINVTVEPAAGESEKSKEAKILTFKVGGVKADINGTKITAEVPFGADLTKLDYEATISEKATILPAAKGAGDFSKPKEFTITAEDGVTKAVYTVIVTVGAKPEENPDGSIEVKPQEPPKAEGGVALGGATIPAEAVEAGVKNISAGEPEAADAAVLEEGAGEALADMGLQVPENAPAFDPIEITPIGEDGKPLTDVELPAPIEVSIVVKSPVKLDKLTTMILRLHKGITEALGVKDVIALGDNMYKIVFESDKFSTFQPVVVEKKDGPVNPGKPGKPGSTGGSSGGGSSNGLSGGLDWESLIERADSVRPGATISITLNKESTVPASFVEKVAGKDVTIVVTLEGRKYSINAKDLKLPGGLKVFYTAEDFVKLLKEVKSTGAASVKNIHVVVAGDCLWDIAYDYLGDGNRYNEIRMLNNLLSNVIYPGQELKIPA